jgi:lipopolysaccharide transport system ATP-binding protein
MSDVAIQVQGLWKQYRIGKRERYKTFRESVVQTALAPLRKLKRAVVADETSTFWALNDLNFGINRGEVVGIIGRNGAGKSTLLKILSRITEPTKGRIEITGRVGSLLEVGTGFHPELTGRENIYLNGAILGMRRSEINAKFDEIVAFSEIEKFLDTPVKYYSSGMYTRLAFAVAAHLEPEILVIDEVLAVGDAEFQKKCLGKMSDVAHQGRTVLFVSHNMRAVEQLCNSIVWLERGKIRQIGTNVHEIVSRYLVGDSKSEQAAAWTNPGDQLVSELFTPTRIFLADANGRVIDSAQRNDADLWLQVEGNISNYDPGLSIGYALINEEGQHIFWSYACDTPEASWPKLGLGKCVLRTRIPPRLLNEGTYRLEVAAGLYYRQWLMEPGVNAPGITFEIRGGLTDSPQWMGRRGVLAPVFPWSGSVSRE